MGAIKGGDQGISIRSACRAAKTCEDSFAEAVVFAFLTGRFDLCHLPLFRIFAVLNRVMFVQNIMIALDYRCQRSSEIPFSKSLKRCDGKGML